MADHDKLRITLKLDRSDCPALYDELAKIGNGARRTMRLRLLAAMGLLNEARIITGAPSAAPSAAAQAAPRAAPAKGVNAAALELLASSDMSGGDG